MAKVVYYREEIIFPRLDKSHYEVAAELLQKTLDEQQCNKKCDDHICDEKQLYAKVAVSELDDGRALVRITLTDESASRLTERTFVALLLVGVVIVALICNWSMLNQDFFN